MQVNGRAIFPAAGMLEAAKAAAAMLVPWEKADSLCLAEITIPSPLLLPNQVSSPLASYCGLFAWRVSGIAFPSSHLDLPWSDALCKFTYICPVPELPSHPT